MDVLSKLRPASRGGARRDSAPEPSSHSQSAKEDILNTLDSFTAENKENNNNADPLLRRSVDSDSKLDKISCGQWEDEVGSGQSTPASLSHSYSLEWEKLFSRPDMMRYLKTRAADGELRSSRFRSVVWKLFLEVLPTNKEDWISKTRASRARFEDLKNKLIVNPRKAVDSVDITLNNPLSQDEESPWNKFFQDNELRLTIKQDVIRTSLGIPSRTQRRFPEVEFFRGRELGNMMTDILFMFSREHATHSYRQGMHELLAPLIFVLHCDHQAFLHACEIESVLYSTEETRNVMKEVMDPAFLEHDAYTMFCQVMETVEPWYLSRDIFCNPKTGSLRNLELLHATPFARSQDLNPSNAIVTKLTRIQDYILKKFDLELHQHLERLEIAPQIYGIRWLRLLFGREFPMQDLLMLWDAIFGDGIGFDLVDYIFVAMLMYIRDILLTNDYATCLTVLMKFPPVADVHYFVIKAMWLREPNQHPRPPNYTHQGPIKTSSSMGGSSDRLGILGSSVDGNTPGAAAATASKTSGRSTQHSRHTKRQGTMMGGFSSFSRKFSRPRTLNVPKSSSEPMCLQTDISPDPRDNDPIGSTVSLSQVEESMFRNVPSASSLARLDAGSNLRSAQSSPGVHHGGSVFPLTPDDLSVAGSPTKFNTLPNKQRVKQKKMSKLERELQQQVSRLQGELHDKENMCRYCSSKLDVHIDRLQQDLSRSEQHIEGEVMVSLAGLKLVRDILNGTLRFSQNITSDEDLAIIDGYYGNQNGTEAETAMGADSYSKGTASTASPESDILLGATSGSARDKFGASNSARDQNKLFHMSSEETASPEEAPSSGLARQSSGESYLSSTGVTGSEGEMAEIASRQASASITSTNPFHDSFSAIENLSGSNDAGEIPHEPVPAPTQSKIKSMFKMNSAGSDKNATATATDTSNSFKQPHRPLYQQVTPAKSSSSHQAQSQNAISSQLPPSFSLFEAAPTSSIARGDQIVSNHKRGPGDAKELASIDTRGQRSRAKSDVTGTSTYWPDFLSSNTRLPWYEDDRDGLGGDRDSQSRERSQSQPVGAVASGCHSAHSSTDGGQLDVNPLYKLKYPDNMEH